MEQIRAGFESGLTMEQVKSYAKSEYSSDGRYVSDNEDKYKTEEEYEMEEYHSMGLMTMIRSGYELEHTEEEIAVYADPRFSWDQMIELQERFNVGLSVEQVKSYANPEFDVDVMEKMRKELEGKSINKKLETL